jgi:hypothetical protein
MGDPPQEGRLRELQGELDAIHRRNGELMTEIHATRKRLELLRSNAELAEVKAKTEPFFIPSVISLALVLLALWLFFRK